MKPETTMIAEARPCPVCAGERKTLLHRQRFADLFDGTFHLGYDVVGCDNCGFAFADQVPPQSAFDVYYRKLSKHDNQHLGGREPDWITDRFLQTLELIRPQLPSRDGRIGDVGCATGGMLGLLKKNGFTNLLGLDPSAAAAASAQARHGVQARVGTVFDLPEEPPFDFLIMTGVLEHVRDLRRAAGALSDALLEGGGLCIEVPDARYFANHRNAPFQEFSIEHINFFSPVSLGNLMRAAGLAMESCRELSPELSREAIEPTVLAVFRKKTPLPKGLDALVPDLETGPALRRYVEQSEAQNQKVRRAVDQLALSGRPVIVWGAGTHTLRLLATTRLGAARIVAFVDSNPNYAGRSLDGVEVITPAELAGRSEPILVSSWVYQREIVQQIKQTLLLPNEVIVLYDI